jgi:hypothetical protein
MSASKGKFPAWIVLLEEIALTRLRREKED